ncbi:diacylglycerol/lipid kinase family protein [Nakamurella sp.]|uniref:diacylglycerol/lipid kinase family protein n=1 Tax=Nakamurella sp. TaxID=1869182 RepID=UPI003784C47A
MQQSSTASQRWLARGAFAAWVAAIVVLIGTEGAIGITLLVIGLIGAVAVLVGGYWFLAKRGIGRWLGLAVAIGAIVAVLVIFMWRDALIVAIVTVALLALGGAAARAAMRRKTPEWMPTVHTPPPLRPFIVMNPRSGGGKVVTFDLKRKAEDLGAEVALLDGPGHVDVAAIVRDAVDRGADLLGVAGGDGTQALVAGICAEHDLPLLVISAGTRNHFALDLGLDRDDPSTCLAALTDGEEVRVDLGLIGDRPFVNNASFGAYAEIVQSPEYRDNKNKTILAMLPDLLDPSQGSRLTVRTGARTLTDQQAILISNNPYGSGRLRDMGRRERIDQGVLGIVAGHIASAGEAAALLRRAEFRTVTNLVGDGDVVIDIDRSGEQPGKAEIPVGVDGEALVVPAPVRCSVRPRALRVRLPRQRPGVPVLPDPIDFRRLAALALGR